MDLPDNGLRVTLLGHAGGGKKNHGKRIDKWPGGYDDDDDDDDDDDVLFLKDDG